MNLVLEDLRKSFDSEITAPPQDVAEKMVQTFAVQRIIINSVNDDGKPLPVTSIREKIPYLFEEMNLVKHFEMLTATRVDQIYKKIEDNRLVLTKYLQSLTENARVLEVVQALAQQFKETTESFIILRDETSSNAEVLASDLPASPCIAVLGTLKQHSRLLLITEKTLLFEAEQQPRALLLVFAMFFTLNMEYPAEADCTLEYLQRCFIGVKQDGCRTGPNLKKIRRYHMISPKVLNLIQKVCTFRELEM